MLPTSSIFDTLTYPLTTLWLSPSEYAEYHRKVVGINLSSNDPNYASLNARAFVSLVLSLSLGFLLLYLMFRVVFWAFSRGKRRQRDYTNEDMANYLTSTCHAVVSAALAWKGWMELGLTSGLSNRDHNTYEYVFRTYEQEHDYRWEEWTLGFTSAYLLFDLMRMIWYTFVVRNHNTAAGPQKSMFVHHIVIIVGYCAGVSHQFGIHYKLLLLINETTTPFLNNRFFLKAMGLKSHSLYMVNDMIFALGFLIFRIIPNTLLITHVFTRLNVFLEYGTTMRNTPAIIIWVPPVLALMHVLLNYYWFAKIARLVYRKLVLKASHVDYGDVSSRASAAEKKKVK